jgi:hypothetical protein
MLSSDSDPKPSKHSIRNKISPIYIIFDVENIEDERIFSSKIDL